MCRMKGNVVITSGKTGKIREARKEYQERRMQYHATFVYKRPRPRDVHFVYSSDSSAETARKRTRRTELPLTGRDTLHFITDEV